MIDRRLMMWSHRSVPVDPGHTVTLIFAPMVLCRTRLVMVPQRPALPQGQVTKRWVLMSVDVAGKRVLTGPKTLDDLQMSASDRTLRAGEDMRVMLRNETQRRLRAVLGITFVAAGPPVVKRT